MTDSKSSTHILETTIANGANVSQHIAHDRCRGIAVMPLSAWTAADIVFEFLYKGTWYPLMDKTGARLRISGVVANKMNVAPPETWALGRFEFRLVSVAVGAETAVNQGGDRTLVVEVLE